MKAPIHIVTEAEFAQWLTTHQQKNAAAAALSPNIAPEKAGPTASETNPALQAP
jgi:heme/copper-type cytochrome/quinol oxidase subunit 2